MRFIIFLRNSVRRYMEVWQVLFAVLHEKMVGIQASRSWDGYVPEVVLDADYEVIE